ncbi:cwf21 domain-containing protein [Apodospora peruviana]|uniref:Cwf21 domain-containing protein n=1 Tax=Apodospora peruviana TaxID=516989 RepID=A0AAE0HVZ0_9PEZI|nr:cwf21 domain-containing protein [Apodospora peruviana]
MSDNVGLSTPRGSGTSGYVQRNLAHMRPRDLAAPYARDRDLASMRHQPRKPDQGLLEHDRKREVEVRVFELRDKLEDEGVDEDEIDAQCDELRKKLIAEMEDKQRGGGGGPGPLRKNLKTYQVHELADAKIKESERLRQALKISKDYEEGSHWRKQEDRLKKALERPDAAEPVTEEPTRSDPRERETRDGGRGGDGDDRRDRRDCESDEGEDKRRDGGRRRRRRSDSRDSRDSRHRR